MGYSGRTISNLINFFRGRSTDFVLGRTVGAHGLGIFNVASEIAMMPASELVAPLNRAVYPAYSRLTGSPDELRRRFLQVFGMIGLVTFPASFGLVSISELAVKVLLGSQWIEAIPIVSLVAVCGLSGALQSNMHVYILAVGRPEVSTYFSGIMAIIVHMASKWLATNMPDFSIVATMLLMIILGGISYTTILLGLWLICKRPSGAEQVFISTALSKLRNR